MTCSTKTKKCLAVLILKLYMLIIFHAQSTFTNPIIPGFNPDPSICKAVDKFYLVTSTFEYFPGVPVYESKDLVNWKQISNVLTRKSQLNLDSAECSQGIYAPTIRYQKGIFYMITTLVLSGTNVKKGHFVVTSTDPAGEWSDPHFIEDAPGIDPDLFFDDSGKVYMSATVRTKYKEFDKLNNIWIQELDIQSWKLKGEKKILVNSVDLIETKSPVFDNNYGYVFAVEGPHLYKKDGWYYSTFSHGGTSYNHAFSIFRSKNIYGPYEGNPQNPILTHRNLPNSNYITSTGHADMIQYKDNKWAIVYLIKRQFPEKIFQPKRHFLGRETSLSLIDWSGDWPIVNPSGQIKQCYIENSLPDLSFRKIEKQNLKDDFNNSKLAPNWLFIRNPNTIWWSLTTKKGWLEINLRPETAKEKVNPSYICTRQEHAKFEVVTKCSVNFQNNSEEAGLMLFRERNSFVKCTLRKEGKQYLLKATFWGKDLTRDSVLLDIPVKTNTIALKMKVDHYKIIFEYSLDSEKTWKIALSDFDLENTQYINSARFTGPMIGLYASSNGQPTRAKAYFDYFRYFDD